MRDLNTALLRRGLATVLLLAGASGALAASDATEWNVTLPAGASKTTKVRIVNRCAQSHGFLLEAVDTRFLRFPQPVSNVRIPAVGSVEITVVFDSSGLQPGTYRGRINVQCNDCQRDPGCAQDRDTIPVELTVQEPLTLEGVSVREGLLAFDNQQAFENVLGKLERLDRERGRRPGGTTVLEEFEARFSHTSLRKDIARRQERLAESGALDESNDPDAFFIQDEYLRTVLNDRLEIQIGSSIFRVWDSDLTIEIPSGSLKVLERLRSGADPFALSPSEVKLHSSAAIRQESSTCQASFAVSPGKDLKFGFSSQAKGTEPISHLWTFGDGSSDSTERNPQHTFPSQNPFTVCLSILDATGCSDTHCRSVQGVNCFADFSVTVDGHTATFTNQSTSDLDYQWRWQHLEGERPATYLHPGRRLRCLPLRLQPIRLHPQVLQVRPD